VTDHTHHPGPGRSTSDDALSARKKEIAQRNERAQKKGRELRAAREQEQVQRRRQEDDSDNDPPGTGSLPPGG
jgi:hypothetical protein